MDAVQKQALKYEPTTYKNCYYKDGVFEVLQSLRKNKNFCDIKLQTDDGEIVFGHKLIFISASPYFHAMFTSFQETNNDHVNIRELDSKVLQLLVDYMYTGEITVTPENVQVVLPAADLLQLDYVKQTCVEFLTKQLDPSNCLGIKAFADIYNCNELLLNSEEFIKRQFIEVVKYDEFLSLSCEEVIKLISCDDISVPFEERAFECVINWVKHELDCRIDFLSDLMEHVRLPLVSKEYLLDKVVDEPLLKSNPKCKDYVFEALHFNLIKSVNPFAVPLTVRSKPRPSKLQKVFLVVFMRFSDSKLFANWYNPVSDVCRIVPELNILCSTIIPIIGVMNDRFVFAVGGDNPRSVEMLDVSSQDLCWVPKNELLVSREYLGIGVLNNCLYAVGGLNIFCLNSVEVFNFCTQQWKMISSMSVARSNLGVGVLNNLIYAVGGYNGTFLKSVECYDPSIDKWHKVAPMSVCRCDVSVGVLDGKMYAIGGRDGSAPKKSVEAYEPSTGVWKYIPDMHLGRQNADVIALDGLLYVMGGINIRRQNYSFEIYNPNTNHWSMKTLSNDISICGAVVVNYPSHL